MDGAELIAQERRRQIDKEGFSATHDDRHEHGELVLAAIAYAEADEVDLGSIFTAAFSFWPWDACWWKPRDRISNLIRAGALIAAEIDRLQRKSQVEK